MYNKTNILIKTDINSDELEKKKFLIIKMQLPIKHIRTCKIYNHFLDTSLKDKAKTLLK